MGLATKENSSFLLRTKILNTSQNLYREIMVFGTLIFDSTFKILRRIKRNLTTVIPRINGKSWKFLRYFGYYDLIFYIFWCYPTKEWNIVSIWNSLRHLVTTLVLRIPNTDGNLLAASVLVTRDGGIANNQIHQIKAWALEKHFLVFIPYVE